MPSVSQLKAKITRDLQAAGKRSAYTSDANESDPRYRAYGVRKPEQAAILKTHRAAIRTLSDADQRELGRLLVFSGYGEQQTCGLSVLEAQADYFTPDTFSELDALVRQLHGWSKVDGFAGTLLRDVLWAHPEPFLELVRSWNADADMWLRRMSVVLFTRKVAAAGQFNDVALDMCEALKHAPEDLVRKGVGWCLKDLMASDKKRVLAYVHALKQQNVSTVITTYAIRNLKGAERAAFLSRE